MIDSVDNIITDNNEHQDLLLTKREIEWKEVEDLIAVYQEQFINPSSKKESDKAGKELLVRFAPLFNKYLNLIKNGYIIFKDPEMRSFINSFIEDNELQKALNRKSQSSIQKSEIAKRFKFIIDTYGSNSEEEILMDLKICFLVIAKRYKPIGRSFCGYLYNTYKYEVSRYIKKQIKNPLSIPYKILNYEECINGSEEESYEQTYDDNLYENNIGIPNLQWILGNECSDLFKNLDNIERKIIVKYYLEEWNDRQIACLLGIHINTVNQKRRTAIKKLAKCINIDINTLKRSRKSGKLIMR